MRMVLLKFTAIAAVIGIVVIVALMRIATPAAAATESPKSLYISNCARCHGADGRSQTNLGRKLDAPEIRGKSPATIIKTASNGKGDMPSFRRRLSTAQVRSIATYVHSL